MELPAPRARHRVPPHRPGGGRACWRRGARRARVDAARRRWARHRPGRASRRRAAARAGTDLAAARRRRPRRAEPGRAARRRRCCAQAVAPRHPDRERDRAGRATPRPCRSSPSRAPTARARRRRWSAPRSRAAGRRTFTAATSARRSSRPSTIAPDVAVAEVSSFQLEWVERFRPRVGVPAERHGRPSRPPRRPSPSIATPRPGSSPRQGAGRLGGAEPRRSGGREPGDAAARRASSRSAVGPTDAGTHARPATRSCSDCPARIEERYDADAHAPRRPAQRRERPGRRGGGAARRRGAGGRAGGHRRRSSRCRIALRWSPSGTACAGTTTRRRPTSARR